MTTIQLLIVHLKAVQECLSTRITQSWTS